MQKVLRGLPLLLVLFFITSCSSNSNSAEQVQLIEYENCLNWTTQFQMNLYAKQGFMTNSNFATAINYIENFNFEYILQRCEDLKP